MAVKDAPFTVLIDSAEQHNWDFRGICDDKGNELIVPIRWQCLGRYPHSTGDYSIDGFKGIVGVERKSKQDLQSTILGFKNGRRERLEKELENFTKMKNGIVIVEASRDEVILNPPDYGLETKETKSKQIMRSLIAFEQDYQIPFAFCGSRQMAQLYCFRYLERFWRKNNGR